MHYIEKNILRVLTAKGILRSGLKISCAMKFDFFICIWRGSESQAGSSKPDFTNKVRIALREMRESNYWLRIISSTNEKLSIDKGLLKLIDESEQ